MRGELPPSEPARGFFPSTFFANFAVYIHPFEAISLPNVFSLDGGAADEKKEDLYENAGKEAGGKR